MNFIDTQEMLEEEQSMLALWYKYLEPEEPLNFEA